MYLGFLIFDLIHGTPREDEESAIKHELSLGVLTSVYMVFLPGFLRNRRSRKNVLKEFRCRFVDKY
jgi:hypothetical protein